MDDSEDVMYMMEFRQTYRDLWLKFLKDHKVKDDWLKWESGDKDE